VIHIDRIIRLDSCEYCYARKLFGTVYKCTHPKIPKKLENNSWYPTCPTQGFVAGCPLTTLDEFYEREKTHRYYEETSW
jgi:hypothetical protein